MKEKNIVDARNLYEKEKVQNVWFQYIWVGR
jgi:hypothetical protein